MKTLNKVNSTIISIIAVCTLISCAPHPSESHVAGFNSYSGPISINMIAFGDSHTYGSTVQPISYTDYLSKRILHHNVNYNYAGASNLQVTINNQSMGGSKFEDRHQFDRIMTYNFLPTDTAIMLLGFNDTAILGNNMNKLNEFKDKLASALLHITSNGATAYVGTCIKTTQASYIQMNGGSIEACNMYAEATREVVSRFIKAVLVDTNAYIEITQSELPDGVHFSTTIHQKIAALFYNAIINR